MIRRTLSTVSAVAVLALIAAAPAVACNQPASGTSSPQAQQEHAKFADRGFFRRHHRHHGARLIQGQHQAQPQDQQPQQDQQQGGCHHGDQQD